jgi:hypothetical protein
MSDDQINVAIAEACGWVDRGSFNESRPEDHKFKRRIGNTENYEWRWQHKFNYCNNLNAMHEAEETLKESEWNKMFSYLTSIQWKDATGDRHREDVEYGAKAWISSPSQKVISPARATARQRAEAFLRTLGKWEEGK